MPFGIAHRDVLLPEMVVEMQIEQGAVHVEQDGVDGVPVDHLLTAWSKGGSDGSCNHEAATTRLRPLLLAA